MADKVDNEYIYVQRKQYQLEKMTIQHFNMLKDFEKENVIYHHGRFLRNYVDDGYTCDVFQLFSFKVVFRYKLMNYGKAVIYVYRRKKDLAT